MPRCRALLLTLLPALVASAGCGDASGDGTDEAAPVLPGAESRYGDPAPTWAWRDEVHYGDRLLEVPGGEWVDELQRTPYGFFLALVPANPGSVTDPRTVFFDGAELTAVPGDPHDLRVSEDGRYAGWVVLDPGPRVLVVDLRSGQEVLSHDDLGERTADPENEDPDPPTADVLGFADGHVYFDDPADQLFRAEVGEWDVEELGPAADHELGSADFWASASFGDGTGVTADGRAAPSTRSTEAVGTGLVSPDGRYLVSAVDTSQAPTRVTDAATGADLTPDYGHGSVRFAGWTGPDEVAVVVADDWTATDGEVRTCDLGAAICVRVAPTGPPDEVVLDRWSF